MEPIYADLSIRQNGRTMKTKAAKMRFCPNLCFTYQNSDQEQACYKVLGEFLLSKKEGLALYGQTPFLDEILKAVPELTSAITCVISDAPRQIEGLKVVPLHEIPSIVKTVFLCDKLSLDLSRMTKKINTLNKNIDIVTPHILPQLNDSVIPQQGWIFDSESIYPIDIPEVEFEKNQDLILIDCPARNLALMPNGLAYVHNALKKTNIKFQTFDLDIIAYHRFHSYRLLDSNGDIYTKEGYKMAADPWLAEAYDEWHKPEVIGYFRPLFQEAIDKLIAAKPKILGLSVQACNIRVCREVVKAVKEKCPETLILVGGYSCYQSTIGMRAFPECDYMCLGEADLTIGPLVEALARGERPTDLPGVMSRFDSETRIFKPGPQPQDLDALEIPKYEWTDLNLYKNYNNYQLTPIIASRGCRWSRCTFCAERFFWRVRSPKNVVDEFEYLNNHGCDLFMFNESDLNGKPEILMEICNEIVRRGLKIRLTGQLRINKHSDRHFFDTLRRGGFTALRFGVDAWSTNALRMQLKGYTPEMVYQNLKDCWEAGIYTEVNTVIGVPGETDRDIDESIELMVKCKPYIGRQANINPLMLVIGSVYWEDPDRFKIHFRKDRKELFEKYPTLIPHEHWYSEEPYIDQPVRLQRFEKIVKALYDNGFEMGAFASQVVKDVKEGRGADHSARPDVAHEQDEERQSSATLQGGADAAKMVTCDETSLPQPTKIKVQSGADGETSATVTVPYRVFKFRNEFYGIPRDSNIDLGFLDQGMQAKEKSNVFGFVSIVSKRIWGIVKDQSRLKNSVQRAWRVLRTYGLKEFMAKIMNRLRKAKTESIILEPVKNIDLKRDYSASVELFVEGVFGYNIINVKREYYGIKQGFPFDKEKADDGKYNDGVCFKGDNVKDVEAQIKGYVAENGQQRLLEEGYCGYNFVEKGITIYAIQQGFSLDDKKAQSNQYPTGVCFYSDNLEKTRQLVNDYLNEAKKNPQEQAVSA